MKILEFGDTGKRKIILLHGFQCPWQVWNVDGWSLGCIDDIADFKLSRSINTPNTVVYFFHGTALNEMLAKKSAKYVRKCYPTTIVKCFKGKFHCENALFNPDIMISELDKIFDK